MNATKYLFLLLLSGCVNYSYIGDPPVVEGYEVLGFRQPKIGELMWLGNDAITTNTGYKCECWVVRKK